LKELAYTLACKEAEARKRFVHILNDYYRVNSEELDIKIKRSRESETSRESRESWEIFSKSVVIIVARKRLNYKLSILTIYLLYKATSTVISPLAVIVALVEVL